MKSVEKRKVRMEQNNMDAKTIAQITKNERTPLYVFDLDALRTRVRKLKEKLGARVEICYAMKANPFLIEPLQGYVDCFEVCSPGEFHICERSGIPREKIVLSGVYKNVSDMESVLDRYGQDGIFTVESGEHLRILAEEGKKRNLTLRVLLRVTSGNQFGMDPEVIREIICQREAFPQLDFVGLQWYSGTQKKTKKLAGELEKLDSLLTELNEAYGYEAEILEYGPGFPVSYFQNEILDHEEELQQEAEMLDAFSKSLDSMRFRGKIVLEMGRFLAAFCGYYVTRIVDQKRNLGQNYCIVDGGIHHLNYFGQMMAMKIPKFCHVRQETEYTKSRTEQSEKEPVLNERGGEEAWNICGSLCTVSDVIVKQLPLVDAKIGDVLVFERTGAYSVTEGIYLFLSRDLPQIFFWSEENGLEQIRGALPTNEWNSVH